MYVAPDGDQSFIGDGRGSAVDGGDRVAALIRAGQPIGGKQGGSIWASSRAPVRSRDRDRPDRLESRSCLFLCEWSARDSITADNVEQQEKEKRMTTVRVRSSATSERAPAMRGRISARVACANKPKL
uniref:Predicted protein n=1 Tax=Hordeum vulgare subsp. vulgare TaxID=112509 RepID=F2ECE8_HORVV|nr:predicted protein [Hordeum vulgare subsp. vulgare]